MVANPTSLWNLKRTFLCRPIQHATSRAMQGTPRSPKLDSAPNIGPLISRWELEKFKNCWNTSFRTFEILTLLYQQFSNLLISQRDMSGPRLGALSNNRWSGGTSSLQARHLMTVLRLLRYDTSKSLTCGTMRLPVKPLARKNLLTPTVQSI